MNTEEIKNHILDRLREEKKSINKEALRKAVSFKIGFTIGRNAMDALLETLVAENKITEYPKQHRWFYSIKESA